jgi:hypothetical protein
VRDEALEDDEEEDTVTAGTSEGARVEEGGGHTSVLGCYTHWTNELPTSFQPPRVRTAESGSNPWIVIHLPSMRPGRGILICDYYSLPEGEEPDS